MKNFVAESYSRWFVVRCKTKRQARTVAVEEFGRGRVKSVREATQEDVDAYLRAKSLWTHDHMTVDEKNARISRA